MSERNVFLRFMSALWRGVNGFRKVLHLLLLLFVFAVFLGAISGGAHRAFRGTLLHQPVRAHNAAFGVLTCIVNIAHHKR